jgi:hypothetical protein
MEKKSGSWYRRTPEIIAVSNLQKSNYGPRYYFNHGFWLRSLGNDPYPKEWRCHVRTRLEDMLPGRAHEIERLLDLGASVIDEERIAGIRQLFDGGLLPIIEQASTVAGLLSLVQEGELSAMVSRSAQEVFEQIPR